MKMRYAIQTKVNAEEKSSSSAFAVYSVVSCQFSPPSRKLWGIKPRYLPCLPQRS